MKRNKLAALFITLALTLFAVGCGDSANTGNTGNANKSNSNSSNMGNMNMNK